MRTRLVGLDNLDENWNGIWILPRDAIVSWTVDSRFHCGRWLGSVA